MSLTYILPHAKYKRSICISDYMQTTFFYLERFLKKPADDQCSCITKDSIYQIKHMYIQPFTTVVDWPEIWRFKEVSTMHGGWFIFADTSFVLGIHTVQINRRPLVFIDMEITLRISGRTYSQSELKATSQYMEWKTGYKLESQPNYTTRNNKKNIITLLP